MGRGALPPAGALPPGHTEEEEVVVLRGNEMVERRRTNGGDNPRMEEPTAERMLDAAFVAGAQPSEDEAASFVQQEKNGWVPDFQGVTLGKNVTNEERTSLLKYFIFDGELLDVWNVTTDRGLSAKAADGAGRRGPLKRVFRL